MPNVARGASVLGAEIVRVRRQSAYAVSVAVPFRENVVSVHRDVAGEPAVEVQDELVLAVTAARLILEDVATRRRVDVRGNEIGAVQRTQTTIRNARNERTRQRRINRPRAQHVQRANVDVAGRERDVPWQLALDAEN